MCLPNHVFDTGVFPDVIELNRNMQLFEERHVYIALHLIQVSFIQSCDNEILFRFKLIDFIASQPWTRD